MAYRRDIPRVALLIETSRGYGRQFLKGVIRYARLHGPWGFYITPGDLKQVLPRMRRWGGTGIIARVETPQAARAIVMAKLPAILVGLSSVRVLRNRALARFSQVHSDSLNAGRLAAEHLLERGFRHFAYVGLPGYLWAQTRLEGFRQPIGEAGFSVEVYPLKPDTTTLSRNEWGREHRRLAHWLARLPRPLGLMACNDDRGERSSRPAEQRAFASRSKSLSWELTTMTCFANSATHPCQVLPSMPKLPDIRRRPTSIA